MLKGRKQLSETGRHNLHQSSPVRLQCLEINRDEEDGREGGSYKGVGERMMKDLKRE